jgi:hypothetical protein
MFSALVLPPGYSLQILYDPEAGRTNVIVTVLRDRRWAGEIAMESARIDQPGALQGIMDSFIRNGAA